MINELEPFFADTYEIDEYEDIVEALLRDVFGITQYMVSDQSSLGDFALSCLPSSYPCDNLSYDEVADQADDYMIAKIYATYGIKVAANELLLDVCKQIKSGVKTTLYH